jgi:hypothetical protein
MLISPSAKHFSISNCDLISDHNFRNPLADELLIGYFENPVPFLLLQRLGGPKPVKADSLLSRFLSIALVVFFCNTLLFQRRSQCRASRCDSNRLSKTEHLPGQLPPESQSRRERQWISQMCRLCRVSRFQQNRLPKAENLQGELPPELLQSTFRALQVRSAPFLWWIRCNPSLT